MKQAILIFFAIIAPTGAFAEPTLEDLAFMEGRWRSDAGGFIFEEIWSAPEGGVMAGMARGVADGKLQVLEYLVIAEEQDRLIMRFKHFNADYSTWEADAPVTLSLTAFDEDDATFSADPPSETVGSIRYRREGAGALRTDVVVFEEGKERAFSFTFSEIGN